MVLVSQIKKNTNGICHCRRRISNDFEIDNPICAVVESDSTTAQRRYSIADDIFLGVLQWEIRIVLLLSLSQQQHKGNLPLQKIYFWAFCNENSVCAVIESNSTTTQKDSSNTDSVF